MKQIIEKFVTVICLVIIMQYGIFMPMEAAGADTPENLAKRLIVKVTCKSSAGAGIIVGLFENYAFIATAEHILGFDSSCELEFEFLKLIPISANIVHREPRPIDMAILRAELPKSFPKNKIPLSEITCAQSQEGQSLHVIGHPGGDFWDIPQKDIRLQKRDQRTGAVKFNFSCLPGFSGGGLFSENWSLLGMILEQDGAYCSALDVEAMRDEMPENIFGLKCTGIGETKTLLSTLKKFNISSSTFVVGFMSNLTGPLATQSEYQRIKDYFKTLCIFKGREGCVIHL